MTSMNNMKTKMTGIKLAATFGVAALFFGLTGMKSASADDWRDHRDRVDIRFEVGDVRHDEDRLHDLQRRRDIASRHRDWSEVHRLDFAIGDLRRHIDYDRRNIRQDVNRYHRDENRDRDRDYRNRDRDRDYRNH